MLEIAVLGLLSESPMHGYELRKRLAELLGTFRAFSYGSLYPTLRRLSEAGWIDEEAPLDPAAEGLRSRRGKRVYQLTAEGKEHFASLRVWRSSPRLAPRSGCRSSKDGVGGSKNVARGWPGHGRGSGSTATPASYTNTVSSQSSARSVGSPN